MELYRQRISTLTRKKLDALTSVAGLLDGGTLNKYFKENEDEFYAFFNANKRLDVCLDYYFKRFKKLVDIGKEYKELGAWLDTGGADYARDKTASAVVKKLTKAASSPLSEEDILKHLQNVCEIYEAMERIRANTKLSQNFTSAFGRVDFFDARKNFLADLYTLHELCATLFMDYNADSFNSMCVRAANDYTKPVLKGLLRSVDSFRAAGGELFGDHQRRPRANPRGGRPRVLHRQSGRADRQYRHAGQLVHVPRHRGKAERRGAYVYDRRAGERRSDGRKYRR